MTASARFARPSPTRLGAVRITLVLAPALIVGAWGYILTRERTSVSELFDATTWAQAWDFASALLGADSALASENSPRDFLDGGRWWELARLAHQTVVMSVLAIWIATTGMLATVMLGARPRNDAATGPVGVTRLALFGLVRAVWVVTRAVPELVWALLLIFVLPPGILAGAIALGIHNFGIVGKLCSEVVEDLDQRPARALRASGAGSLQTLLYAVLPQALPKFLTYSLYRWEVIMRTTIVVGFVSAGGLGREFRLAMSFFHYTDIAMILATYFFLVIGVDALSAALRRRIR